MGIKTYRELEVWQLAMSLAEDVYGISASLPADEKYALASQLRRAAVSIPSNVAEGFGRDTTKDFLHFLAMARGSLFEVMTQLELAVRLGYVPARVDLNEKAERVGMMLNALCVRLRGRLDAANLAQCSTSYASRATRHVPRATNHEPRATPRATNHEPRATSND